MESDRYTITVPRNRWGQTVVLSIRRRPIYSDRGEHFPGVVQAARAVGIDRNTLYKALCLGLCRAGRRWAYVGNELPTAKPEPVAIIDVETGQAWRSSYRASKELGVNDQTIVRHALKGRITAGRMLAIGPDYAKGPRGRKRRVA